jgi:hypothetical protein
MIKRLFFLCIVVIPFCLYAEIKNLDVLLKCTKNSHRVQLILKTVDFAPKIKDLLLMFHALEDYMDISIEQENILKILINIDKILLHSESIGEKTNLNELLVYFSIITVGIDSFVLKVQKTKGIDQSMYIHKLLDLKMFLNEIETPLRDLVENYSFCSTKKVFEAAGKKYIKEQEHK